MAIVMTAGLTWAKPVHAQWAPPDAPITIDGVVKDNGVLMPGKVVVAWCGGISYFGGSDVTDANGHFIMHTTTADCPMGATLSVVVYNEIDASKVDGFALATVHTQTTVEINIGDFSPVSVPEYDLAGGAAAILAGGGAIAFIRRRVRI